MTNPSTLDRILHNHVQSCEFGTGARGAARLAAAITTLCNGAVFTMKTLNTLKALAATTALACGLAAAPANAAFIDGSIAFNGMFTATGGTGLADATGIDIFGSSVIFASGDFMPASGLSATFASLMFAPANTPLAGFWNVNAGATLYSFDLASISVITQNSGLLTLSGSGTLSATGFDDTAGNWTFAGGFFGGMFSFSTVAAASPVPVPAPTTLLLIGLGLTGVVAARRNRRR